MLDAGAYALALDATYVSSSDLASYQRILGIVLEITSAKGRTMDVHTWCEKDVATVFEHLVADAMTYALDKFLVPRAGQSGAYGETGGIIGVGIAFACGTDTHTGRTIGKDCGRNAEARDGTGGTSSTWDEVGMSADDAIELLGGLSNAVTYAKGGFLLEGHCLEDFIYVVGTERELLCRQGLGTDEQHGCCEKLNLHGEMVFRNGCCKYMEFYLIVQQIHILISLLHEKKCRICRFLHFFRAVFSISTLFSCKVVIYNLVKSQKGRIFAHGKWQ